MSCNLPTEKNVRKPADCRCYGAVMRTYKAMSDEPHHVALQAAQRVYRHHHPEDSPDQGNLTVERWVADQRVH